MSDFIIEITGIFDRDIQKTIDEINLYRRNEDLWILHPGINNSAGTLALHMAGNLQHFIGSIFGKTGYKRNKDEEFSTRDISKEQLISELEKAKSIVSETLNNLNPDVLKQEFPLPFYGKTVSNYFILIHLASHLNYHLGQINYHRRLLTD